MSSPWIDMIVSCRQQKNVQFHGWSSRLICFRSCCICALSSAVPIITALRQAREANIPRSLEGRHLRHVCDRQRQPAGKGDKNRGMQAHITPGRAVSSEMSSYTSSAPKVTLLLIGTVFSRSRRPAQRVWQ